MTALQKGRIFISYRRADSAGYAGRIYDRLMAHFGKDAVFMDVDTIEAGLDFVVVLQNAVQSCDVLVALIGRQWIHIKDENGERRLDNPEDFVRIEIAAALDRDIRVIPVLVDGTSMPNSTELPGNLKPLTRRNALQVNHHSFNADVHRLISQLELALKAAEDSKVIKAQALREEQERKQRKEVIDRLLESADLAINLKDWDLAREKLTGVLELEPAHAGARGKLDIVQRKIAEEEEARKEEVERKREQKKRDEAEAQARKIAEDKARKEEADRKRKKDIIAEEQKPVEKEYVKPKQPPIKKSNRTPSPTRAERRTKSGDEAGKGDWGVGPKLRPYAFGAGILLLIVLGMTGIPALINNMNAEETPLPAQTRESVAANATLTSTQTITASTSTKAQATSTLTPSQTAQPSQTLSPTFTEITLTNFENSPIRLGKWRVYEYLCNGDPNLDSFVLEVMKDGNLKRDSEKDGNWKVEDGSITFTFVGTPVWQGGDSFYTETIEYNGIIDGDKIKRGVKTNSLSGEALMCWNGIFVE